MTTFDLFSSVRDGNTDIVRHLLQSKQCRARLNERNEWGDTALHLSAEAGNAEICQMLIAAGASVTVRNNRGETCLHRAAVGGHVASVSAIVGRDQDPESINSQNDAGYTALHHAAKHGSKDLIEILVKAGADRLIENNAGETPYMVARKFDQILAERLLLDVEQHHAELAIREMNRKEKDIVRAYFRAVKQASHIESRVRLVLSGDKGTGKSSLKKTMFGEPYDPREKPTSGIIADQSVTRITFKQYREWVQQPASKADTLRLNLEYIDSIIDFVLKFLRQPRVVQDEAIESIVMQIEKELPKNVNFNLTDSIIPEQGRSVSTSAESKRRPHTTPRRPEVIGERNASSLAAGGGGSIPEDAQSIVSVDSASVGWDNPDDSASLLQEGQTEQIMDDDGESVSSLLGCNQPSSREDTQEVYDDPLSRFAELADPQYSVSSSTISVPNSVSGGRVSPILKTSLPHTPFSAGRPTPAAGKPATPKPVEPISTASLVFNRSQRELSRLLVQKIPLEILKRMVIRWPVGDEQFQDRSELNANRLTINVWDASGDPLQQSFIPFFYSNRSVFAITYDLSKSLDALCESYLAKGLKNVDGSIPTNAEVLEDWISCALVHSKDVPTLSFKCTQRTPVLPPIIITCTNSDCINAEENAGRFVNFFARRSFQTYKKHLVESTAPIAVRVSNRFETLNNGCENESDTQYSGHHMLRREIDYLARQMPYIQDEVPIQWVKFEQLLCDLNHQKKVILLYDDLSRYITEHCQMSGPLRILPVLSQFHDVGTVVFFYRHPELCKLVVTRPQWLLSSLGSIITSHPGTWITNEVKTSFKKLSQSGVIGKDMVQLAYRCARMGQRYWNEMLFILNCMDLLCCHPSLHEKKAYYIPSMVMISAPDPFVIPTDRDPVPVHFSTGESALPMAIFNQLVVRSIRSGQYEATVYHKLAHIRLNVTHHLLLWKEHTSIVCLVQSGVSEFCQTCRTKDTMYEFSPSCSAISHLIGDQSDLMPSDNISRLMETSTNSGVDPFVHLSFPDSAEFSYQDGQDGGSFDSLKRVCPKVLQFITKHLQFLCSCWFPGLILQLQAMVDFKLTSLDQQWKHTVLQEDRAPRDVQVWFD